MKKLVIPAVVMLGMISSSVSFAFDARGECPADAKAAMDATFGTALDGTLTSEMTQCLYVRERIKVAVNVSSNAMNATKHISQQINNVQNMVDNYEKIYGIPQGKDGYQIAVVGHGGGGRFMLTDDAYNITYNTTTGNSTRAAIEKLLAEGVQVFVCQNTMRANGWKTADIIPGVKEVPAGVTAVTDFGMRGWVVLTP